MNEKCYAICEDKCRVETMSKKQIENMAQLPVGTVLTVFFEKSAEWLNSHIGYGNWTLLGFKTITFDNGSTILTTMFVRAS